MKRLLFLSLALIWICSGACAAAKTIDALVGDVVDIWAYIENGGTVILTPKGNSPAPTQSRLVLKDKPEAFHVKITDVGIFKYSLSVEPDQRDIVFDDTVYDVEIHALYEDDALRTAVVIYNRRTGEKYTSVETYDPETESYTHSLSVNFSNSRRSTYTHTTGGGGKTPTPRKTPDKGKTPDTGTTIDTGNTPDTGITPDNGNTPDTGTTIDTGNTPDTGITPDNGNTPDTGTTIDTGNTPDTGITPDHGNTPNVEIGTDTGDTPDVQTGTDTGDNSYVGTGTGAGGGSGNTIEVTEGTPTKSSGGAGHQPKTGDDSQLTRYLLLAIFASAGLFVVSVAYYISVDVEVKKAGRG